MCIRDRTYSDFTLSFSEEELSRLMELFMSGAFNLNQTDGNAFTPDGNLTLEMCIRDRHQSCQPQQAEGSRGGFRHGARYYVLHLDVSVFRVEVVLALSLIHI